MKNYSLLNVFTSRAYLYVTYMLLPVRKTQKQVQLPKIVTGQGP